MECTELAGEWSVLSMAGQWSALSMAGQWSALSMAGQWSVLSMAGQWSALSMAGQWSALSMAGQWSAPSEPDVVYSVLLRSMQHIYILNCVALQRCVLSALLSMKCYTVFIQL